MCFAPLRATAFWGALLSQGQIYTRRGCSGTAWVRKRPQCICPTELRPWMPTCPCCTGICICTRAAPQPQKPPTALLGPHPALCAPFSTHSFSPSPSLHPCPPILTSFLWGGLSSYHGAGGPPVRLSRNAKCPQSSLGGSVPAQLPPSPSHLRLRTITELPAKSPSPSTGAGGGSCHPQTAPKRVQPPCIPWEPLQGAGRG